MGMLESMKTLNRGHARCPPACHRYPPSARRAPPDERANPYPAQTSPTQETFQSPSAPMRPSTAVPAAPPWSDVLRVRGRRESGAGYSYEYISMLIYSAPP